MPLNLSLDVTGDPRPVKVSASDVANPSKCGRFLVLKTHPGVREVDGWRRLFSPWDDRIPFPLGDVVGIVLDAHKLHHGTYEELSAWVLQAMDERGVHRLLRSYTRQAVENVLEAHDSIEAEVGPFRLLAQNPQVGPQDRLLTAWAPLYETENGIREIRRFRIGSVRDKNDDRERWSVTAAYIAATYRRGAPPQRVRVVEIGAMDGSSLVIFDGTPEVARTRYAADGRRWAAAIIEEDHVVPCRSCGDCKAAGSCRALIPLDGMLGQPGPGHSSRSVSPGELEQYLRCPGQWLLNACVHLPKEDDGGEGAARGYAVHRWLEAAHSRRTGCSLADLPSPGSGLGLAAGALTETEYEIAYPFLAQHVGRCPLADAKNESVIVEKDLYGYDHDAEVVPVTRPDLVYRTDDKLVVREFKTAKESYASGRDEAYDRHLQIPFLINMLNSGLLAANGARTGAVELELLTDTEQFLWSWDASDAVLAAVAAGSVHRAVQGWHDDKTWNTKAGPYCAWCPVRRWCPDSDVWQAGSPVVDGAVTAVGRTTGSADDEPPF